MKGLWPEASFEDVFDSDAWTDECPIDKYGLWEGDGYDPSLDRLGIRTSELLRLLDPEEYERIKHDAEQWYREWQRRNPKGALFAGPNIVGISEEEEDAILKKAGLTLEQAKRLVAGKTT